MLLGNDIVDLRESSEKHLDEKFLQRVFTHKEQECIQKAENPNLVLWMLWAAKESIYKIATKMGPVIFSHQEFSIEDSAFKKMAKLSPSGRFSASAHIKSQEIFVIWEWTEEYVHCLARAGVGNSTSAVELCTDSGTLLTEREKESVHSIASQEVRVLAKNLLRKSSKLKEIEIIRTKKGEKFLPPTIFDSGMLIPGLDLSLSHDGRFIAAAVQN